MASGSGDRLMANRMLSATDIQGNVIADGKYDSNKLSDVCDHY